MNDNKTASESTPVDMQPGSTENHLADEPDLSKVPTTGLVKQEPMDTDQGTHSPNNDSGISPGHGSSGQPSPAQNGPLSSPEQYNGSDTNKIQQLSYLNQHILHSSIASFWGINPLQNPFQTIMPQNNVASSGPTSNFPSTNLEYQPRQKSLSPKLNIQLYQNANPKRSPTIPTSGNSPRPTQSSPKPTSPQTNAIIPEVNVPPGFNPGLSDDNNSRSSSHSSSESLVNYGNEYLKMEVEQNPLHHLQMTVEQAMMARDGRGEPAQSAQGHNGIRNTFQCTFCSFNTVSRTEFNDHNKIHWSDLKCNRCDFVTKVAEDLENHLREVHMVSPLPEEIGIVEDGAVGITVPKVNSQGKVKVSRCKQCGFIGHTKKIFWKHCRTHIKPEKMLTCPRCPFVTEYKHHLEYHLRNHAKSKPFKCDQCTYTCVNKSMLNSHLKSHSSVYQYRCADCSYLTKYCHSLKLHLRKYLHNPAVPLNPDGSPNPNPVIDVYGTRRGPRQRSRNTTVKTPSTKPINKAIHTQSYQYPFASTSYAFAVPQSDEVGASYPYGPVIPSAFPVINNTRVVPAFPQNTSPYAENRSDNVASMSGNMPNENFNIFNGQYYHMTSSSNHNNNNIVIGEILDKAKSQECNNMHENRVSEIESAEKAAGGTPLDLSKPDSVNPEDPHNIAPSNSATLAASSSAQKTTLKNRRKGQAFKLEHISRKLQQQHISSHENQTISLPTASHSERSVNGSVDANAISVPFSENRNTGEDSSKLERNATETSGIEGTKDFSCQFCGISFIDAVLYTIHKGYHGYQDPFQCNMCGVQTGNKIEFNLHIARESHS